SYRPLQDAESRQLLFDVLGEWDEYGEKGVDFHHHFQRAMASTIYCLIYGYRLKTGYEKELVDGQNVQAGINRTAQQGAYIVDSFPSLNHLPRFLAPWKREAEGLYELERQLHVGNLEKGLADKGWNFSKFMSKSNEAKDMGTEELAFDLGVLSDAALDTSTITLSWLIVAWITNGAPWVKEAQALLDEVVGKDRLPTFEDRPKLALIDAIGKSFPVLTYNIPEERTERSLTPSSSLRDPPLAARGCRRRSSFYQGGGHVHGLPHPGQLHRSPQRLRHHARRVRLRAGPKRF
ncbi:cytochrome P450, partial [Candidatus Bathyarchaeota archaeon]|nr:cytochrome P450 [Candidatus Bathyarchaeota archaeon]